MQKDDLVYAGPMLDAAVEALAPAEGQTRADFDNDRALALALTHLLWGKNGALHANSLRSR